MELRGSMPHSQGLSNNSYPEPNQPNYPDSVITCPKYHIFSIFVTASNEIPGLTFCKISLLPFLSTTLLGFFVIHIDQNHQVFFLSFFLMLQLSLPYATIRKTNVSAIFILVFQLHFCLVYYFQLMMMMMIKSVESVRLLVILADALGSIPK